MAAAAGVAAAETGAVALGTVAVAVGAAAVASGMVAVAVVRSVVAAAASRTATVASEAAALARVAREEVIAAGAELVRRTAKAAMEKTPGTVGATAEAPEIAEVATGVVARAVVPARVAEWATEVQAGGAQAVVMATVVELEFGAIEATTTRAAAVAVVERPQVVV